MNGVLLFSLAAVFGGGAVLGARWERERSSLDDNLNRYLRRDDEEGRQ